jgi:hypothetical protein
MADDHVDQTQRASPLRDGARFVGRAVIHDNDFDQPQSLSVQRRDRGGESGTTLKVGMITLTEALLAASLTFRRLTPNKAKETSENV